ncbi:hypothetical protein RND71_014000 [Anisodus tanguticus]|uniref:Uncharacterized protein n=1 Tax=Anisodus tanguticus TaxID=243964 RepID=A0AAE1S9Y1_9SOLA|nr:hypothetical protein RND71_014000 [Anisodus tanguticus]
MLATKFSFAQTCILRPVDDINADRWQRTITKVLANVQVINFRMNKDGTVEISGTVFPNEFLKILRKARKKVELCHFQFGECSSNLFLPPLAVNYGINNKYGGPNYMVSSLTGQLGQKETEPAGYYGGRDGRFLHYGDKPSQSKKSKDSSHDHNHNHNHIHGRDHNHNHNHVHERDQNQNHRHNHVTKVQLDCDKHNKQMKGRAEPLQSQGVNSCCLM